MYKQTLIAAFILLINVSAYAQAPKYRSIVKCSTGVRSKASSHVGSAGGASAQIPVSAANLGDIALNDTSDNRDV